MRMFPTPKLNTDQSFPLVDLSVLSDLKISESQIISSEFENFLSNCSRCNNLKDQILLRKAFHFASKAHAGMRRNSGEPYILHRIAVADIVVNEIGLGAKSAACALLHDVVSITDYNLSDIYNAFGTKIGFIVEGLAKIKDTIDSQESIHADTFRNILLTLSDDIRVIFIKLADRLHNMKMLSCLPIDRQKRLLNETLSVYIPLAHRLGLYPIKIQLEDLCLKHTNLDAYNLIASKIHGSEKTQTQFINKFSLPIINSLTNEGFEFSISGRSKSIFSIWKKMEKKNISFEEVYDLFAIRIVFTPSFESKEIEECWQIYSHIMQYYSPRQDRLRDWVSEPKSNGYEALHTTVMGPKGRWVEVQIRSERMNEVAEVGFAAHWKYKGINDKKSELDASLKEIRQKLEEGLGDDSSYLDNFKMNLFASEIHVFTPKGKILTLPKDSTALDFAFSVHTDLGMKSLSAKVNHRLVSLDSLIRSGDQVEIISSASVNANIEWLHFVKTTKAKSAIRDYFDKKRIGNIVKGEFILDTVLDEHRNIGTERAVFILKSSLRVNSDEELFCRIGSGSISYDEIVDFLKQSMDSRFINYWSVELTERKENLSSVLKIGDSELIATQKWNNSSYQLANCCDPLPGDPIIGIIDKFGMAFVHKPSCEKAKKFILKGNTVYFAKWTEQRKLSFLVRIELKGKDNKGLVSDMSSLIYRDMHVNIKSIHLDTFDGHFTGYIDLYVQDTNYLSLLVQQIKELDGMQKVTRKMTFDLLV